MTKSHVALQVFEKSGIRYYKKVVGEETKNHKLDSEDLKNGGTILFEENYCGFNPELFFHLFLEKQDPDTKFLFSHIRDKSKIFNLASNPDVWFTKSKVGKNTVSGALPLLCEALGLEKCTMQMLRATGIRSMKRGGAEDREICKISGHKTSSTLQHYDSVLEEERHLELSRLISNGGRKRKPSSSISMEEPKPSTSRTMAMPREETFSEAPSSSIIMETTSPKASKLSTNMEATSPDEPSFMNMENLNQYEESDDDSCDEVFTQEFTQEGTTQFLKKEQEIADEQIKAFREHQRLMAESLKIRCDMMAKKRSRK